MAMPYHSFRLGSLPGHKISRMKALGAISLLALVLAAPALAQNHLQSGPPVAGYGPTYDTSLGYTYLTTSIHGAGQVNLNGIDAGARVDFTPRWGITADSNYVRTSDVFGTGNGGYVLTFLAGPVFYPVERGSTRLSVHALAGAGLVDSVVPTSGTTYLHGWVARYAYALGGGIERSITGRWAVRADGDFLRTAFVDSSDTVQLQNNFRATVSVVFRLHGHSW